LHGLLEYFNRVPQYANEFYTIYRFSRVTAVKYHFEVVNRGEEPIEIQGCVLPYQDAVSPSTTQVGEKPGVVRKIVSGRGGMDRAQITKSCVAQDWFGNNYFTRDFWVT